MRKYDIWSEGYYCSGMEGQPATARCLARGVVGEDFIDAVQRWYSHEKDAEEQYGALDIYKDKDGYDVASVWSCRLFPSEGEARKSFG